MPPIPLPDCTVERAASKIKVTPSFMVAYNAMRSARDIDPSPLFECFRDPAAIAKLTEESDEVR